MKNTLVRFLTGLFAAVAASLSFAAGAGSVISLEELKKQIQENKALILVDVRTPEEYAAGHIKNALLAPLQDLENAIKKAVPDKKTYFVVYCRSGRRSTVAAKELKKLGYENFRNYKGSINEWTVKGNPLVK